MCNVVRSLITEHVCKCRKTENKSSKVQNYHHEIAHWAQTALFFNVKSCLDCYEPTGSAHPHIDTTIKIKTVCTSKCETVLSCTHTHSERAKKGCKWSRRENLRKRFRLTLLSRSLSLFSIILCLSLYSVFRFFFNTSPEHKEGADWRKAVPSYTQSSSMMDYRTWSSLPRDDSLEPLPFNWEMAYTETGMVYFIE